MALVTCHFFSEALQVSTAMTVLLPQATHAQIGLAGVASEEAPPVLYLLHGLSDDETIWTRRTSIERYTAELGLAVVMPRAGRSFYSDERHGHAYWTFLSEELPRVVEQFFRVSHRRADTFVAGLSMGGYGALKWALRHPDRFAAAASLSGTLDVAAKGADYGEIVPHVWGGGARPGSDDDLFALLERADLAEVPHLYVGCGASDGALDANRRFLARAAELDVVVHADVDRPGRHDWAYWDDRIQDVLAWLPIRRG